MYNRYIPQSDGTFRRSIVQERPAQPQTQERNERKQSPNPPPPPPSQAQAVSCSPQPSQKPEPHQRTRGTRPAKPPCQAVQEPRESSAGAFLRNLLPRNLDTGDLLIIVLLLLMAGDSPEDQNNALLTLAIYMFL